MVKILLHGLARLAWGASHPRGDLFDGATRAVEDENNKAAEKTANHKEHWVVSERKKKRSRYQSDDGGGVESHDDSLKAIFDYFSDAREKRSECVGFIHGSGDPTAIFAVEYSQVPLRQAL